MKKTALLLIVIFIALSSCEQFRTNSPKFRFPIDLTKPNSNYQFNQVPSIKSISNYYTKSIKAEYAVLDECVEKLRLVQGQIFTGGNIDDFDFYIYPYVMNSYEALEYYNSPNVDQAYFYNQCLSTNGCNCDTPQKIVDCTLKGRMSIYAKVGYKDKFIASKTHRDGAGQYIHTIYNVGRLCPPKCQN